MAHIRRKQRKGKDGKTRLGNWQAIVTLPSGKQITHTDPLKGVVVRWAAEQEDRIRHGDIPDPRAGRTTLAQWREEWLKRRVVTANTADKDESRWRVHVEPRWGDYPLEGITREALEEWVADMAERMCPRCYRVGLKTDRMGMLLPHKKAGRYCPAGDPDDEDRRAHVGLGKHNIQGIVACLSGLLTDAVEKRRIPTNPAAKLPIPKPDPKAPFFWTRDEFEKLLLVLPDPAHTLVDLDMHVGLRWGELAGLKCRYVDTRHKVIHVIGVLTRRGWREYPKSRRSARTVPIPAHLLDRLWQMKAGRGEDELLFTAPEGGPLHDGNFRKRVFYPALASAAVSYGTPHDMRHTAASWLVMAGVDLYRVQALLGHEKFTTTQKYAHLAPDAHDEILAAWGRHQPAAAAELAPSLPAGGCGGAG